ncbi:MAG: DUF1684 domain-containing protein [Cyclobacteriaceae bacterium]|nr:MAG: DUF1684 domain-containing protein [Cyclobacteriaceae bacterium]
MKSSKLIPLVLIVAVVGFVIYSMQNNSTSTNEDYLEYIQQERVKMEKFMQDGVGSPFSKDSITFEGLKFYPADVRYRIKAKLKPIEGKKVVLLSTSDGKEQKYLEYAFAEFELDGVQNQLLILEVMEMGPQRGKLFLAFSDETSGSETYGAGRYLDVKKVPAAKSIELDFNLAYNPYCAYNDNYSCPFPPKENLLKVAIRAGEMNYHP